MPKQEYECEYCGSRFESESSISHHVGRMMWKDNGHPDTWDEIGGVDHGDMGAWKVSAPTMDDF